MRQLKKQIALLERVDRLIRLKATGRPKNLATKLQVSEATVFRIIETMKELDAPVYYDFTRGSYLYSENKEFKCGFFVRELSEDFSKQTFGGVGMKPTIKSAFASFFYQLSDFDSDRLDIYGQKGVALENYSLLHV